MVKLTQKNDVKLTVEIYAKSGDLRLPVDLRGVDNVVVNIQGAQQGAYTWSVNNDGHLVIDIDGVQFRISTYPLFVTGLIDGRDWCYAKKEAFQIVRWTDESNIFEEGNIIAEIPMPPIGHGDTTLSATTMTMDEYLALTEKDENTLYIIVDDRTQNTENDG